MSKRLIWTDHGLPQQPDVELPLLRAIEKRGGTLRLQAEKRTLLKELAEALGVTAEQQRFTTNDGCENLWWNWVRQVRRMLVHKGDIHPPELSGREVWSLTEQGLQRLLDVGRRRNAGR